MTGKSRLRKLISLALLLPLSGLYSVVCQMAEAAQAPKGLILALTPSQDPTALQVHGKAFADALAKLVGVPIKIYIASDYAGVVEALRNKTVDLGFLHPVGYVLANREARAQIVVKDIWHGKTSYTARIFVRKDSGIKSLEDLRGRTIAFVDPASSSGYIYPMVLFMKKGLVKDRDPKTFFKEVYFAGSHDAALLALLNGSVDAAASFDMAREQYLKEKERIERLTYMAETPPIPEAGIAAREGLDPALVKMVEKALLAMNAPEYKTILKNIYNIDGFAPAKDSEYDPVREAVDIMGLTLKKK